MKRCFNWLLAAVVICLSFDLYGLTMAEAKRMSNPRLQAEMRKLSDKDLAAFCKAVFNSDDKMLQSRIKVQLQRLIRSKPVAEGKALMENLNREVPKLNFAVSSDGSVVVVVGDGSGTFPGDGGGYVPRGDSGTKPVSQGANRTGI